MDLDAIEVREVGALRSVPAAKTEAQPRLFSVLHISSKPELQPCLHPPHHQSGTPSCGPVMQPSLFPMPAPALPPGCLNCPEKITPEDERRLLNRIADLPFKEFQFHGFESKRKGRVIRLALRFQRAKGGQRDRLCKQRVGPGTRSQISER